MAVVTTTAKLYIESASGLEDKLDKICAIIEALEDLQVDSIGKSGIAKYTLKDGQVDISADYRSAVDIEAAIFVYEKQKQRILNKLNGRVMAVRSTRGLR